MRTIAALWMAGGCVMTAALPLHAQTGAVVGMRLAPSSESTELTIQTEGSVSSRSFQLDSPARVVVDVRGASHALPETDYGDINRGGVRGIRTSQFDDRTVRIVVDLEHLIEYEVEDGDGWIRLSVPSDTAFERWATGDVPAQVSAAALAQIEATPTPPQSTPLPSAQTVAARPAALVPSAAAPTSASSGPTVAPSTPDTIVLTAMITQLAGTTVYIDQGESAGLIEGDTLALLSGLGENTLLHVISSSPTRSVLAFLTSPVPLTRGDRIRLEPRSQALRVAEDNPMDTPNTTRPAQADAALAANRPSVSGRIFFDLNALQSSTSFDGAAGEQSRTFLTPTTRLNATATNLPGGFQVDLNARGSYRHASGGQVPSTTSIRFYDFSARKTFEGSKPVRIQLGRFYNPYESFSGYWDGGLVRVGSREAGIGAAVGYRPDYSNEGFSTDLPKLAVFADLRRTGEGGGFQSDLSFHRVTPLEGVETHTFMGWAGRAWRNSLQWSHEVQVDRVAETGEWILTEFEAYASAPLRDRLRVYGRFSQRQPFDFWNPERQLAYRRDGLGGGINWSWNAGSASADIGTRSADEGPSTTTYSGSVQLSRVFGSRLGFSGWGSYWDSDDGHGMSFSPAFTHPFGKSYGRLGYRFYSSESVFHSLDTHALIGSWSAPLTPGLRMSLQGQASWGGNLQSFSLYTGLWKSF